jgi:hypothetical protein
MFLVGRLDDASRSWDYQGVFSTKEKAESACRDSSYFFYPIVIDIELPHETMVAPDIEWPKKC